MIYLFFAVLFVEMLTILLLLFKTPFRKLLIIGLDRAKRGRAPLVVKSVGATVFVIMMYNVYSVTEIQSRPADVVNPTDQILLAYHMLEASLMGNFVFLLVNCVDLVCNSVDGSVLAMFSRYLFPILTWIEIRVCD